MSSLADFSDVTRFDEPLAPRTWLRVGGPARRFVEPRSEDELAAVLNACRAEGTEWRLLGGGSNLLVRDAGVDGAVLHLSHPAFARIEIDGTTVRCGAGARLSQLVSQSVQAGLAGLEVLAGIPGTVGGALHGNAGGHGGDIGQFTTRVRVLSAAGELRDRTEDELTFGYRSSSLAGQTILVAEFRLQRDDPEAISQRMRKIWIAKKASQPLTMQSAGCIFKNPRGLSAGQLVDQAGLKGTRIGGAEISDRHANFVVTHEGARADDVLQLIDLARSKVAEAFGVDLELEIEIW
jgi:UDP-N-acetylmuramate dehydrogenase